MRHQVPLSSDEAHRRGDNGRRRRIRRGRVLPPAADEEDTDDAPSARDREKAWEHRGSLDRTAVRDGIEAIRTGRGTPRHWCGADRGGAVAAALGDGAAADGGATRRTLRIPEEAVHADEDDLDADRIRTDAKDDRREAPRCHKNDATTSPELEIELEAEEVHWKDGEPMDGW